MRFTYHPALIKALKDQIPAAFRRYAAAEGKSWIVDAEYADEAITLLVRFFPNVQVEFTRQSRTRASAQTRPTGNDHFRILHLRETAPVELIEASYRVLARLYHPDRGGTHEAMQELNGAYAALRERVSA